MDDPVILKAQEAFTQRLRGSSDVSENTKNSQAIAKSWRAAVDALDPDRYRIEALVAPEFDQRIDVLDPISRTAYEFKVSGKGAHAEFYKDVVKVLLWNRRRKERIATLVFITEEEWGRRHLDTPMLREYIRYLGENGLQAKIVYVRHS